MSAGLHLEELLNKPERLTCLPEVRSTFRRYLATVGGNYKKLGFTLRVCTLLCHFKGKFRISCCIIHNSLAAYDNSFQETGTLCIVSITYIAFIQLSLGFGHNAFVSDFKNFPILYSNVSYTIVEIISWCKNIVIDGTDCFRCHICCSELTGSLAFPVFVYLAKICFGLL